MAHADPAAKAAYQREYYRANKLTASLYQKARYQADPEASKLKTWTHSLKKFGITPEQYDEIYEAQGRVCAICGREEQITKKNGVRRLAVDHNHETGVVRGLLCFYCNTGLGKFGDSRGLLVRAIEYLDLTDGEE